MNFSVSLFYIHIPVLIILLLILVTLTSLTIYLIVKKCRNKKITDTIKDIDLKLKRDALVSASQAICEIKKIRLTSKQEVQVKQIQEELELKEKSLIESVPQIIERLKKDSTVSLDGKMKNLEITYMNKNPEVPQEVKEILKTEVAKIEQQYPKGIIPKQKELIVNYELPVCDDIDNYCFYKSPRKGNLVFPYRRHKIELRGKSEERFYKKLKNSFAAFPRYLVLDDVSVLPAEGYRPYEPDIAIIEKYENTGLHIDIEIDEPYSGGLKKKPIHFVGCGDDFRDKNFVNLGWLVIRFSERQVVQEPEACISYIKYIISSVDKNFKDYTPFKMPHKDKRWTETEANIMIIEHYREKLWDGDFGTVEVHNYCQLPQSEQEKELAKKIKPISIPRVAPHNIDNSKQDFVQDDKISFEPNEHIYLLDGKKELKAVSNVLDMFFTPFDALSMSKTYSERHGMNQGVVLETWDRNGKEAREVGTFMHAQIESFLNNKPTNEKMHFSYCGKYIKDDNRGISIKTELNYFHNFLMDNAIVPFRTEWHIYNSLLNIAGTIDLLCKNGDTYDIYDWKRSKKASPNESVWRNGINGLEHVPDISFYHYAIQQNLYKYILETNYDIKISNMYIVVLHPDLDTYKKYQIPKMDKEIGIIKERLLHLN